MHRNLALEFVRVTEAAAIASSRWVGRGDKLKADGAAVEAMRDRFNDINFAGTIVIGEGSKDEAPELYNGEKVGKGKGEKVDLAVDPLECTDSVAYGRYNALSVIAAGPKGTLFSGPDTYMEKIAAGPRAARAIDIDAPVATNVRKVAKALGKKVSDVTVMLLERDRHKKLIGEIRKSGARVRLITDGDIAGAIAPSIEHSGMDLLMGVGASAEAVLAAVAIRALGGEIYARFKPKDEHHAKLVADFGLSTKKIYRASELAKGDNLMFTATGVIDGPLLQGVSVKDAIITTHSLVIHESVRYITTHHKSK